MIQKNEMSQSDIERMVADFLASGRTPTKCPTRNLGSKMIRRKLASDSVH